MLVLGIFLLLRIWQSIAVRNLCMQHRKNSWGQGLKQIILQALIAQETVL